ncbi:MAG: hypothetical protein KAR05_07245 [Candidatus Omnitrophica bacterium]|nr:hypothetical protein [Candidatus Omnitrophota bacterium]
MKRCDSRERLTKTERVFIAGFIICMSFAAREFWHLPGEDLWSAWGMF